MAVDYDAWLTDERAYNKYWGICELDDSEEDEEDEE